jgi:N-acetyl-anhydromuramyl-L-alanine amidase AmpD
MTITADSPFRHVSRISREGFTEIIAQQADPAVIGERDPGEYYDVARQWGVDPLLLLGMFKHESQMGRLGTARQTKSWGNTRNPSFGAKPIGEVPGRSGVFPVFASWLDGATSTVARLASRDWPTHAPYGVRNSIKENDPHGYLASVLSFMNQHEEANMPDSLTIIWTPGTPNMVVGRAGHTPKAVVVHIAQGSEGGTISWFLNPESNVSSHFFVCLDGRVRQFVKVSDTAWANGVLQAPHVQSSPVIKSWATTPHDPSWPAGLPNLESISIELEGNYENDPSVAQWRSLVTLITVLCIDNAIPAERGYIIGHYQITSRDKKNCPGLSVAQWDKLVRDVQEQMPMNNADAALEAYWQAHKDVLGEKRVPGAGELSRTWGGEKVLLAERGVLAYENGIVTDITQRAMDDLISLYWTKDGSLILYGDQPGD